MNPRLCVAITAKRVLVLTRSKKCNRWLEPSSARLKNQRRQRNPHFSILSSWLHRNWNWIHSFLPSEPFSTIFGVNPTLLYRNLEVIKSDSLSEVHCKNEWIKKKFEIRIIAKNRDIRLNSLFWFTKPSALEGEMRERPQRTFRCVHAHSFRRLGITTKLCKLETLLVCVHEPRWRYISPHSSYETRWISRFLSQG